jgi:methylglutaconyl-CoA hydratase
MDLFENADNALISVTAQHVTRLYNAIHLCPIVTIAAVQGDAIAGGGGLVAACDYALIAKGARMGFPEIKRGLIAAQVSALLCRQICLRDIRELLLFGELVDSSRAVEMRLANREVEGRFLMEEAIKTTKKVLIGAPGAIKSTKQLLNKLDPTDFFEVIDTVLSFYQSARHSEEAKEGISAFLEKREPKWNSCCERKCE